MTGFLSLSGLLAITAARSRGAIPVSETERAYLRYRDDRKEFDDWITRIDLPDETFDRATARADTRRDLVDFAIDSDTGVVEDPETGRYYAVGSEYLCVYEPPARGPLDRGRPPPRPTQESLGPLAEVTDGGGSDADP